MQTRRAFGNRSTINAIVIAIFGLSVVGLMACARPPWPPLVDRSQSMRTRLEMRHSEIESATYRVRWEARGTEPHGQFILRLAYRSPDLFYVSGLGPLDIPAFTGVVRGDEFWFIDHHNDEYVHDQVANLGQYNVPLSAFFTTLWRDLFSGGWGGDGEQPLRPSNDDRDWYVGSDGVWSWRVEWDADDRAPKRVIVQTAGEGEPTTADVRCHRFQDEFPYWEMDEIALQGYPGGGQHRWEFRDQKYNVDIPDRFFRPLARAAVEGK
ncbi:MAG: hypothetical protein GF341_04290 [candidate division Zixibacteria bacterium]|nr:hypothetical protein [candidate division Zixibacteria bacterium]